ncbi:hypothetical protein [Streptomyces osmaniensis]|uniref:Uncharacterized protein n=1 Tax=Streptomyces osmaniensis TaxID=593134 RepID=A0ABP6YYP4_9ACTN
MNPTPQHGDDGFEDVINSGYHAAHAYQPPAADPTPYGTHHPAYSAPVKPGLTKRGKAVLAIGTVILASGGMFAWQDYASDAKAADIRAQELQYKRDLLALEMQKEINKTNEASAKAQETADAQTQKQVKACVEADKGLIGKQLGTTYSSVMKDCQAQYGTSSQAGTDIQEAASASDSSGVNQGVLIGGGVLVLGLIVAAKKATRPAHA